MNRKAYFRVISLLAGGIFLGPLVFPGDALAQESQYQFETLVDTSPGGNGEAFIEISMPLEMDGRTFFKAYSITKNGETVIPGIYEITENGLKPFFVAEMNIPGTGEPFQTLGAFDIEGDKIAFVGWGENKLTMGLYLFDGEHLITVTDVTKNVARRTLRWENLNDVFFLKGKIVFTGGVDTRDGLFIFPGKEGDIEIVAHKWVDYWRGKKIDHKSVRSIQTPRKTDNKIIFPSHIQVDGGMYPYLYQFDGETVEPLVKTSETGFRFPKEEIIRSITGSGDSWVITKDNGLLGGIFSLQDDQLTPIVETGSPLWPRRNEREMSRYGKQVSIGDTIKPGPEMEMKKYTNEFPFWRTVFSLYEIEGLTTQYYIKSFIVGEEFTPIRPQSKRVELIGNIGAVIGAGIAAALTGGAFIAPIAKKETRLEFLARQAFLQGFGPELNISWSRYFQSPLMVGNGGFSGTPEKLVFHGANLQGEEGIFKFEDGQTTRIIDTFDTLGGYEIENLYVGFGGLKGEEITFWAEIKNPETGFSYQSIVVARELP